MSLTTRKLTKSLYYLTANGSVSGATNEAVDCVSGIDRNIWCGFKEWSGNLCGWSKTESNMDRQ